MSLKLYSCEARKRAEEITERLFSFFFFGGGGVPNSCHLIMEKMKRPGQKESVFLDQQAKANASSPDHIILQLLVRGQTKIKTPSFIFP